MQARSREEVAELASTASRDVLGFLVNVVRIYDSDAQTLEPVGRAVAPDADLPDRPTYDIDEGLPGKVFSTGESRVADDLRTADADVHTDVATEVGPSPTHSLLSTPRRSVCWS